MFFALENSRVSVGTPCYEYDSMLPSWRRCRAILNGETAAKEHDQFLDTTNYTNLLVPFSPSMRSEQYRWYVAEAELPGLVSQYARLLVSGLLRKEPFIKLPEDAPPVAEFWIKNFITEHKRSLISFLSEAIWEEISTQRGLVSIDFPSANDELTDEERRSLFPYPKLWKAEEIINWQTISNTVTGEPRLSRVVTRYISKEDNESSEFHQKVIVKVSDHYLDENGVYTVQHYRGNSKLVRSTMGRLELDDRIMANYGDDWEPIGEPIQPKIEGNTIDMLPFFFLNGSIDIQIPMLLSLVNREVGLYNKVTRRNHLLYGASTYTPVVYSDMTDEDFAKVVSVGLGSWLKLGKDDRVDMLQTPTTAINDLQISIDRTIDEMSRMGIRMLSPEEGQSGIAIEMRNAPQTSQLGLLNTKISQTMVEIINFLLYWKYGEMNFVETEFNLSADFDPSPLGVEWLRLVTEWYQSRIIPRSTFLKIAKRHDILPQDYKDEEGIEEIEQDTLVPQQQTIDETGV